MVDYDVVAPSQLSLPGNIHIRISNPDKRILKEWDVHNRCTEEGKQYILYCLTQAFTPLCWYFAITTDVKVHIFKADAIDENDRGSLIRELITAANGKPRARFKFYLQTDQLNGEILQYIHLYGVDRNGNEFAMFTATHAPDESGFSIIKTEETTISYQWEISLRNEEETE